MWHCQFEGLVDCDACFVGDFTDESFSIPVSAVIGATTSQVSISVAGQFASTIYYSTSQLFCIFTHLK